MSGFGSRLRDRVRRHPALPATAAILVLALSTGFAGALQRQEDHDLERSVALKARSLASSVQGQLTEHTQALAQVASDEPSGVISKDVWDIEALGLLRSGFFHSVAYLDSTGRVVASLPAEGSGHASPVFENVAARTAAARTARITGRLAIGQPIFASDGRARFITAVPNERGTGALVAESLVPTVLRRALDANDVSGYSYAVYADGRELYADTRDARRRESRWMSEAKIGDQAASWSLRVWPTEAELISRRSRIPETVLFAGGFFALGLAGLFRLLQTADERALALATVNDRLKSEKRDREQTQDALQRSEEQLRQSQKMEAVGQLAGGIAHDFNNLLTAISGYADFLLADIERTDPRRDDVREIKKAATRAAALTSQLLAFSRRQIRQPRLLDLNAVLTDLERMLRRVIGEDVKIEWLPSERLGSIKADASEIEQVLLNLVVNAGDAMPHGGTIVVTTGTVSFGEDSRHAHLAPGRYIRLSVRDSGVGMDTETRNRIFEPFFTTKEPGKGTGLGLSTVYAIVKNLHGAVDVESAVGRGTTFTVYLPQHEEAAEVMGSGSSPILAPRGAETVLLVEDEEGVRALCARILERHGYTVLEARNGRDAMAVAGQQEQPIDLLLTDVVMPEMGGKQLADALVARQASLRVLFISGYTDGDISRRGELDPCTAFLQKPFTASGLLARVRDVLDESAVAA